MDAFKICMAHDRHSKRWQENTYTLAQLADLLAAGHEERDKKDGLCFVSATLLDGKRNLKSVDEVYMLVYDIDGAQTLEEVRAKVIEANVTAFIYTTYSHQSTRTYILTDHYEKWAKQAKAPMTPSLENLQQYLVAKGKGHLKSVVYDDMRGHERIADMGNCYVIDHAPVDKIRVVFPLNKPITVSKLGTTNAKCNDAYKAIYHGVGRDFGFEFDPSCSDPTRLFYFPSCPVGKKPIAWYAEYDGPLLDWSKVERATITTKKAMETATDGGVDDAPVRAKEYWVTDRDGAPFDMWHWYQRHVFDFDIEALIEQCLNDQILAPRPNGGHTITCPFEAEHSDVGGTGTFACNEDGEHGWTIYCSHASCQSEKRKKLDFLKEWVTQGLITIRDILTDKEVEELEHERLERERKKAAEGLGVEFDTLARLDHETTPEIEEVVLPIQESVKQDPDKFRADIVDRISHAGSKAALYYALQEVTKYNRDKDATNALLVTDDMLVEWLTSETATISLREISLGVICTDPDATIARIEKERAEKFPFGSTIQGLIQMSYAGLNLHREIRRVAGWYGVQHADVRREYDKQRSAHWKTVLDSKLRESFPKLTKQYAKLVHGSKLEILDEERTRESGNLKTLTMEAFHNLMGNEVVEISEKDGKGDYVSKTVSVSKAWTKQDTAIRVYTDVTFDPGQPYPRANTNKYNLWGGFPVKHIKLTDAQRKEVEDYAVRHIHEIWCDKDAGLTQWVLMYFADIFQRPWNKPQSAICVMGGQGSGKSIILDCGFKPILKTMYTATSDRDQLAGKFNKHAEGVLLWLAEESLFGGDHRAMNKLKDLISRPEITIEPKTKDVYTVPNRVRYVFTSNQLHPLNLERDDRRFLVLGTSDIHKQDTEYHSSLQEWFLKKNGAQMWMSYLMDWKFNESNKQFFPKWKGDDHGDECTGWQHLFLPPSTRYKDSQKKNSESAAESFFVEILVNGRITSLPDHILLEQPRTFWWPYEINIETPTLGSPETWHKVNLDTPSKAYMWQKISKTDIRNLFNAYARFMDSSQARFSRNQFGDLWDKYFGRVEDFELAPRGAANPANPSQKGTRLPPRRVLVNRALDRQLLTKEEAQEAADNINSHINNELADKDHA